MPAPVRHGSELVYERVDDCLNFDPLRQAYAVAWQGHSRIEKGISDRGDEGIAGRDITAIPGGADLVRSSPV